MTDDIQTGLLLLVVGMITVFTVLGMVVLTGKLLIAVVNRTYRVTPAQVGTYTPKRTISATGSEKRKLAAVVAAAFIMTKGKGRIQRIQRVEDE